MDYPSRWATITLPQGQNYRADNIALDWYSAAARLGVNVDVIGQHSDLSGYDLILAPDLVIADAEFVERLAACRAKVLFDPRSGSKTAAMQTPANLAPDLLQSLISMKITSVESLPDFHTETFLFGNVSLAARCWRETVETHETALGTFTGDYRPGTPALIGNERARYLATLPVPEALRAVIAETLVWAGLEPLTDLGDLRLAHRGNLTFAFNFGRTTAEAPAGSNARFHIGTRSLPPVGVAVWTD